MAETVIYQEAIMPTYRVPYPALTQEAEMTIGQHLEKLLPIKRNDGRYDLSKIVGAALQNWQDDAPSEVLGQYIHDYGTNAAGGRENTRLVSLPESARERIQEIGQQVEKRHGPQLLKVRKGYNHQLILVIAMLRYAERLRAE